LSATGAISANGGLALAGQAITWNESGVRSWSMTTATTSGSLSLNSGDGLGTFRVNMPIAIGNTVNTVSPTSPNRTVTIVISGTTYYLAAKTTND
jgi:hypothetical protein